jgi:hypothetical protein
MIRIKVMKVLDSYKDENRPFGSLIGLRLRDQLRHYPVIKKRLYLLNYVYINVTEVIFVDGEVNGTKGFLLFRLLLYSNLACQPSQSACC